MIKGGDFVSKEEKITYRNGVVDIKLDRIQKDLGEIKDTITKLDEKLDLRSEKASDDCEAYRNSFRNRVDNVNEEIITIKEEKHGYSKITLAVISGTSAILASLITGGAIVAVSLIGLI